MDCSDIKDDLVDVIYGEANAGTARRVEDHMGSCSACREEVADLKRLRKDLQSWRIPEPRPLAVRIGFARTAPRYLAVAAGLFLAVGAVIGLSGSEVRYEGGQLTVRIGRAADDGWRQAMAAQDARHRSEIEALRVSLAGAPVPASADVETAPVLARVAEMIRESEERQGRRIETGLASLAQRNEAERRYDMARVSAGLSYLEGRNGQHLSRTAALMGAVLDASQKGTGR